MPKKLTLKDMQELAKTKDGYCLSTEYIDARSYLEWKCSENHIWFAKPTSIKCKTWCPKCAAKKIGLLKKCTIEEMQEIAKNKGGRCLSTEYVGIDCKLEWQCSKGHAWYATANSVKYRSWCLECSGRKILSIEEMQRVAKNRNGECLSTVYVNARSNLEWKCSKNHVWLARPDDVKHGNWCPKCANKKRGLLKRCTIEEMQEIAKNRSGECLSTEYLNAFFKLKWKCFRGHIWFSMPCDIKHGSWCPECCTSMYEKICRLYFEIIFNKKFPRVKPDWLRSDKNRKLELDGFCEELGLAFEHQGSQHYKIAKKFRMNKKILKRINQNDALKVKICKEKKITLIVIPELTTMTPIKDLKRLIKKQLEENNYFIPENYDNLEIDINSIHSL